MPPPTSQGFYKVMGEVNRDDIYKTHEVTQRFMSMDVQGGFSTEVYISDYVLNMEPVINRLRRTICSILNEAITWHLTLSGKQDLNALSLTFKSPIESTIEKFRNGNPISANPTGGNK